jgi:hypothetical protein
MPDRSAPLDLSPDRFRAIGHKLVERIATHWEGLRDGPVTPGETPAEVRAVLGQGPMPERGADPEALSEEAAEILFRH